MSDYTGQWAILPARVRYDRNLSPNAKLIYSEIAAKVNEYGYCFAHNQEFSERFGIKPDTVSSLIKTLEEAEYIRVDVDKNRVNRDRRRIYLTTKPYDFSEMGGPGKKSDTRPGRKSETRVGKKSETVPDKNPRPIENNNNLENNPPISPQGDDVCASEPKHKPERFSKLWSFYPHSKRGSKQRAMRAWDKLKPSDELIDTIAKALMRQLRTDEWSRGIGVPHLSSYLNGRLWLDAEEIDEAEPAAMFETDDVEVLPLWT